MKRLPITINLMKCSKYIQKYISENGVCIYILIPRIYDTEVINKICSHKYFMYDYHKYYEFLEIYNKKFLHLSDWFFKQVVDGNINIIVDIFKSQLYRDVKLIESITSFVLIPEIIKKQIKNIGCEISFTSAIQLGYKRKILEFLNTNISIIPYINRLMDFVGINEFYNIFEAILNHVITKENKKLIMWRIILSSKYSRQKKFNDIINEYNIFQYIMGCEFNDINNEYNIPQYVMGYKFFINELFLKYINIGLFDSCSLMLKQNISVNKNNATQPIYGSLLKFQPIYGLLLKF